MPDSKPTHNVCIKPDGEGPWFQVGYGWQNDKGNIAIRLYPCVRLDSNEMRDRQIKMILFPTKGVQRG